MSVRAGEEVPTQMGPLSLGVLESASHTRVSVMDILGYISPKRPDANPRNRPKNQKYQVRMSVIPQGMVCATDTVLSLMRKKYEDHELISLEDVMKDPYVLMVAVGGDQLEGIP